MSEHGVPRRINGVQRDEYTIWIELRRRCSDPKRPEYALYGAKGITVDEEWFTSFDTFFADMGPRPSKQHSIDRIDSAQGYCRDNCRWATAKEQARNRSTTIRVTFAHWHNIALPELAEKLHLDQKRLRYYYAKLGDIRAAISRTRQRRVQRLLRPAA